MTLDRRKPKTIGQRISAGVFRYALGMIMAEKPPGQWTISLGRVATCALLVQAQWEWHIGHDLHSGQKEVLFVLLGYTFGNNVIQGTKEALSAVNPWARITARAAPPEGVADVE